jgi:TPP-dependent 2-oxoacid decarboxylase
MPRASFVSNFVLPTRADRSACRWGSIGYATGASVGMAYAAKELGRRLWLLTGKMLAYPRRAC